jgi:hypothetical protein
MLAIAYKIGAKANNCSSDAQIECNSPKLHTTKSLPAPAQGGRQTGLDLRKNQTNQAFRSSKHCWHTACCRLPKPLQAGTIAEATA